MANLIKEFLQNYANQNLRDLEYIVKTHLLVSSLKILNSTRKLFLVFTLYFVVGTLFAISIFSSFSILTEQWSLQGYVSWDHTLLFPLSLSLLSFGILYFISRESFWLRLSTLDKVIADFTNPSLSATKDSEKETQDTKTEDLEKQAVLIDALIESRVQRAVEKALEQKANEPQANPSSTLTSTEHSHSEFQ